MVYSGKPSKSCEACRRVKTKCDVQKPTCGQCRRAGRQCPGYRDADSLLFRNETQKVAQKANQAATRCAKNSAVKEHSYRPSPLPAVLVSCSTIPNAVGQSSASLRTQAITIFLNQYGCDVAGSFDYVPALCERSKANDDSVLYDSLECLGLAYLSTVTSDSSVLRVQASKKYFEVIKAINKGFQVQNVATSDDMLASVLLLSLFETITCAGQGSLRSWSNHVYGAVAIANSRGPQQFRAHMGRRLFQHVRHYTVMYALQQREEVRDDIVGLSTAYLPPQNPSEERDQALFEAQVDLCTIRRDEVLLKSSNLAVSDPELFETAAASLLAKARNVESRLGEWIANLPATSAYIAVPGGADSLDGVCHVYASAGVVRMVNAARCSRIMAIEVILRLTSTPRSPVLAPAELQGRQTLLELQAALCADICASVPSFYASSNGGGTAAAAGVGAAQTSAAGLTGTMKGGVGNMFIWPLYMVATTTEVSARTRMWTIAQLRAIAGRAGILQSAKLADVLAAQWEIRMWKAVSWNSNAEANGEAGEASVAAVEW